MSDLTDLKLGDRVQVFDVNGSRVGQPKGGWDGTVAKVGRKLIYVVYPVGRNRTEGDAFRLDDGRRNDAYGHQYIETVERAAELLRRGALVQRLRTGGLELTRRVEIGTDTLEALVDVLDRAVRVDQPEKD